VTWHTEVVGDDDLEVLLASIQRVRGTITSCVHCAMGYRVTYVTVGG